MTSEVASPQPNGILEDVEVAEAPKREIKNHILFEISTEAANRGMPLPPASNVPVSLTWMQWEASTQSSSQKPR